MGQSQLLNSGAPAREKTRQESGAPAAKSFTLRSALMGTVAATVLLLGYGRRAYAQSFSPTTSCSYAGTVVTCSGNLGDGVYVDGGAGTYDTLYVTGLGENIEPANGVKGIYFKSAGNITIDVADPYPDSFSIKTTNADGIKAYSTGNGFITITNRANIETSGTGSDGIDAKAEGGNVTVTNRGNITILGSARGIYAGSTTGKVRINNYGTLKVNNNHGISANGYGDVTVWNYGDIYTYSSGNAGIFADSKNGKVTIYNYNTLKVNGEGIEVSAYGDVTVTNRGDIYTYGSNHYGIEATSETGKVEIKNYNTLKVTGYGITARAFGDVIVTNSGDITASREGIRANVHGNGNVTVTNSGAIATVNGEGIAVDHFGVTGDVIIRNHADIDVNRIALRAYAYGGGTVLIENSGNLISSQNDGIFANARGNIELSNSGTITTTGDSSDGIYALSYAKHVLVQNTGTIKTAGTNSQGIRVTDLIGTAYGIFIVSSGSIAASGASSHGIYVDDRYGTVTRIAVSGDISGEQGIRVVSPGDAYLYIAGAVEGTGTGGTAVDLTNTASARVELQPGFSFSGIVDARNESAGNA